MKATVTVTAVCPVCEQRQSVAGSWELLRSRLPIRCGNCPYIFTPNDENPDACRQALIWTRALSPSPAERRTETP